jgi:transposase-like protein
MTTEKLLELLAKEIKENGNTYTDRRKTINEMLRMRGVKL